MGLICLTPGVRAWSGQGEARTKKTDGKTRWHHCPQKIGVTVQGSQWNQKAKWASYMNRWELAYHIEGVHELERKEKSTFYFTKLTEIQHFFQLILLINYSSISRIWDFVTKRNQRFFFVLLQLQIPKTSFTVSNALKLWWFLDPLLNLII